MSLRENNWIRENLYQKITDVMPICSVDVLFFNQEKNKILLFKRTNNPLKNIYFSIGGRLLKNENLKEAAVRQAKRELGIVIKKDKLIFGGVSNEVHKNSIFKNINTHNVNVYWGYILSGNEKLIMDSQHSQWRWFGIHDKELHPFIKEKVKNLVSQI